MCRNPSRSRVASITVSFPDASRFDATEAKHLECVLRNQLIVLIVGDKAAAEVR
jgi:hypothetical protein